MIYTALGKILGVDIQMVSYKYLTHTLKHMIFIFYTML